MDTTGSTNNKKLSQYLHLYLGCEVKYPDTDDRIIKGTLTGFSLESGAETTYKRKIKGCKGDYIGFKDGKERGHNTYVENIKPVLRPLSDMTEEEEVINNSLMEDVVIEMPYIKLKVDCGANIHWMLSKHFDLFGLIEAGLALDKTKLK